MTTVAELLTDFRARFPEFASDADERVTLFIQDAQAIHSICKNATVYLAAHLLVLANQAGIGSTGASEDGGSGEVTMVKDGNESASYKTQADKGSDVFYMSTPYGRQFKALEERCTGRRFSVRVYG